MAALTLTTDQYRDKVLGAWAGKSAGLTLGMGQRGKFIPGRNNFYSPIPGQPTPSAALDFPLVWLAALEECGADTAPEDLAVAWLEHLDYSDEECGYAALNLRRGLPPPASGAYSNWFRGGTRGVMRADLWGLVCPGAPQIAASYAYHDSTLDHSEEGEWAAMFLAAVCSAAFFIPDPLTLVTIGLAMIPKTCRTARAVKTALAAAQRAASWLEARENVLHEIGSKNFSDAPQNMGFLVIGLFYGMGDFGSALCAGVNCGYDSEAVGGALGALLGIRAGRSQLPDEWLRPMGDILIGGIGLRDFDAPRSLTEAADQTVAVGLKIVAARCPDVEISEGEGPHLNPLPVLREGVNTESPHAAPLPNLGEGVASPSFSPFPDLEEGARVRASSSTLEIGDAPTVTAEPEIAAPPAPIDASVGENDAPTIAAPVRELMNVTAPLVSPDLDDAPAAAPELVEDAHPSAAIAERDSADAGNNQSEIQNPKSKIQNQFRPQSVSGEEPAPITSGVLDAQTASPVYTRPIEADPISAIAWTDNTLVKPLLVTPPMAQIGQAGAFRVVLDCGETPAIAYNDLRTLGFYVINRGGAAFSGRIVLLAPSGWQISGPPNTGQRQFIAADSGTYRADFTIRVPEGQARIDIANAITLRFLPEEGPAFEAEFVLMGASCWRTVGPFANFDGEGFDRSYTPEDRPGLGENYVNRLMQSVTWEKRSFPEAALDLEAAFKNSSGVVYGHTILRSPTGRNARLVANTNSGVKVWLNNILILRRNQRDIFRPTLGGGQWAVDIVLQAGDNPIMVKWTRGTEPFQFSLTVSDRYGRGLPEVGNTNW